ncbi:MAG: hypothetical protein GY720_14460 [bacterium]|nr:hypothetical protein [bacterium]
MTNDSRFQPPPIIIEGMPRTGSTKTQKLFSASGDFNWPPMWQTSYPALSTGSGENPCSPESTVAWNPEEMARLAIYLASTAGNHVTGSVLDVDGGLCLVN